MNEKYVIDGRQAEWVKKYRAKFRYVNVRLTDEEHAMLREISEKTGKSMTNFLRSLIRDTYDSLKKDGLQG